MKAIDRLRVSPAPAALRALLLAEVLVFTAVVIGIIWLRPGKGEPAQWYTIALWIVAAVLPVAANLLHGDTLRDSGLRLDTLGPSARQACVATAGLAAIVGAASLAGGGAHFEAWSRFASRSGAILAIALAQQFVLQAFMLRRLRQAGLPPAPAVALAALLFAAFHAPNVVLMGATAVAGAVWCTLFLRHANLFVLGLSHGILSLWLYYALPKARHLGLAVGPKALERLTRYWGW